VRNTSEDANFRFKERGDTRISVVFALTRKKVKQHPPIGAGKVMYLRHSCKTMNERNLSAKILAQKYEQGVLSPKFPEEKNDGSRRNSDR